MPNKKLRKYSMLFMSVITALFIFACSKNNTVIIHVALNGSDNNSGIKNKPLKTIKKWLKMPEP